MKKRNTAFFMVLMLLVLSIAATACQSTATATIIANAAPTQTDQPLRVSSTLTPQPTLTPTPPPILAPTQTPIRTPTLRFPHKTYHLYSTDEAFGWNEHMFYKVKSDSRKDISNMSNFYGQWCFAPYQKQQVNISWGGWDGEPWQVHISVKKTPVTGSGICYTISQLREASTEFGGFTTYMVAGPQKKPVEVKEPVPEVDEKYWSAIWSCNGCDREKDVVFHNQHPYGQCIKWHVIENTVLVWVERQ